MSKELDALNDLTKSIKDTKDQLNTKAEEALKEAKNSGTLSAEVKAKVDELLSTVNTLRQEKNDLEVRLGEAEKAYASIPSAGKQNAISLGEQFTNSEGYKEFATKALSGSKTSHTLSVKATITSLDTSAGSLIEPTKLGLIQPLLQKLTVRDLLAWGRTESNSVEYTRESGFTNNADVVAENPTNPKPESDITFEPDSDSITTIAHWIPASKQVLADVKMLQSYIGQRLLHGYKLKEESQLLHGSGVGLNINGLVTQATAFANPGVDVQNATYVDNLRIAMLQVELAECMSEGFILNPIDWATIELLKDTSNKYLFTNPFALLVPSLWALPVVTSKSMAKNNFLTGAFKMAAQGWDREDVNIQVSTEDRDNFVKNMVTIRCEGRVGLTVFRQEAFVKGTLKEAVGG